MKTEFKLSEVSRISMAELFALPNIGGKAFITQKKQGCANVEIARFEVSSSKGDLSNLSHRAEFKRNPGKLLKPLLVDEYINVGVLNVGVSISSNNEFKAVYKIKRVS